MSRASSKRSRCSGRLADTRSLPAGMFCELLPKRCKHLFQRAQRDRRSYTLKLLRSPEPAARLALRAKPRAVFQASAALMTFAVGAVITEGSPPTDASIVWPNAASESIAAMSPLGDPVPVFESIDEAP